MTIWIIAGLVFVLIVVFVLNETDFWMPEPKDYKELDRVSFHKDIEMVHGKTKRAILMLHEYSGIPKSLEELGGKLYREGFDVYIPAMPGASENVEEFRTSAKPNYRLWKSLVADRYEELKERYEDVVLIGASIGGSIALDVASESNPAAVVTLSSPLKVTGKHYRKRFIRNTMIRLSGLGALSSKEIRTGILSDKAYEISPVHGLEGVIYGRSIHSQRLGLRGLRRKIHGVVCPVMALHAKGDTTVGVENASKIASGVSADFVVKKIYDIPEDVWSRKHRIAAHTFLKDVIYKDILNFLTQAGLIEVK